MEERAGYFGRRSSAIDVLDEFERAAAAGGPRQEAHHVQN
jgi:hypothetical protein